MTDPLEAIRQRIRELDEERARLVRAMAEIEGQAVKQDLTSSNQGVNDYGMGMQPAARVAVAKSKRREGDLLSKIASPAGHTIRSLAKHVGCSQALLSLARDGERSIARSLALKIQAATRSQQYPRGFEPGFWPDLRDQD